MEIYAMKRLRNGSYSFFIDTKCEYNKLLMQFAYRDLKEDIEQEKVKLKSLKGLLEDVYNKQRDKVEYKEKVLNIIENHYLPRYIV